MRVIASSCPSSCKKYDVFVSFRGDDTRRFFTSHLHAALCQRGFETFIDNEIPKGDDISDSLIQAIHDSSLSVVVFSERYASSKWCLNELVEILHCKKHQKQHVVPIFYQVDPSHVRNQKGAYGEAFKEHLKKNPEKVEEWKQALFETASLAGYDSESKTFRDEAELIQNIVNDIKEKLDHWPSSALENIVGLEENCDDIEMLLDGSSMIGIWGMGGIGKTKMAKVVFAKFRSQFDGCCFLENTREELEKHGIKYIRDKLLEELSKDISLKSINRRKVLIVLDDVSDTRHLDYLGIEAPPLGPGLGRGSKVIITSRDKHVLDGRVERIHEAKALGHKNSMKLFNLKAFDMDGYKSGYKEVVERAVAYAQGIPLALTVLGSFLHSRTVDEWESALRKLKKMANQDLQAVLKLSYDALDDEEKEMFLDIAFFLKDGYKGYVMAMLESCGFHASIGLRTLSDKALISIDHWVQMHDLIQSMAFEIVRQECVENPGRRSRLLNPDEIYDVLKHNWGTNAIRGIRLDLSQIRELQLGSDVFRKMTKLRFLKFHSPGNERSCIVNLPSRLESLSDSLRYLRWDNFPLASLPLSFCAENLVELHMPHSHLKKLWDGVQNLVNLRKIDFGGSKQLIELPDFSTAQNLEHVDLTKCSSLCHLHPSILSLPRLSWVELSHCISLMSLKIERQSESISSLLVDGCSGLKEFSFSSNKITYLSLDEVGVEILDFSIGPMEKLENLNLNGSKLKNLPINDMCCNMRFLQRLHLHYYGGIIDKSKLHNLFDSLLYLQEISLEGTAKLTELPNNMKHLLRLRSLNVSHCEDLQSLPELPPSIGYLHASNCISFKTLQLTSHIESSLLGDEIILGSTLCSSVSYLRNLYELNLNWCKKLCELPESIGSLSFLLSLYLQGSNVESLPASIKHLSKLEHLYLSNCRRLRSLPELPPYLNAVWADGCISLEIIHSSITSATNLRLLYLNDCLKLENRSLSCVLEWAYFLLKRLVYTQNFAHVCYPGREVPKWFRSNQGIEGSKSIIIDLPSTPNIIGFIFCSILSNDHPHSYLQCQLYCDGKKYTCSRFARVIPKLDSHNVYLWCDSATFINVHKKMDDQDINYRLKVTFDFSVVTWNGVIVDDDQLEACGVCPIYASEYHNFIQEMESKSNLGTQKETCHDVDENSFRGIIRYASLSLKQGKRGSFEGSVIPKWFPYRSSTISEEEGLQVSFELSPDFDNLKGFIFCFVIPHLSSKQRDRCLSLCGGYVTRLRSTWSFGCRKGWHYSMVKLNSNNVFLWYDPLYCELTLQKARRWGEGSDGWFHFSFKLCEGFMEDRGYNTWIGGNYLFKECGNCLIKECGVRPIYVSEYTNFLQQNRLKVSTKRKRDRSIDEEDQHQLPLTKELKELVTAQGENRATTSSDNGDDAREIRRSTRERRATWKLRD